MTTTKQLTQTTHGRHAKSGKQHAMIKNKKQATVNQRDTVKVNGVTYLMNDMVPREIAAAISTYHPNNFSEKATQGIIQAHGRGKYTRYKVADCVMLAQSKYSRNQAA